MSVCRNAPVIIKHAQIAVADAAVFNPNLDLIGGQWSGVILERL
jgi:hypothetical protein